MPYSQLRKQVDALCRKYATDLKLYRARNVAHEFCDEMAAAVTGEKRGPKLPLLEWARVLLRKLAERRIRAKGFIGLYNYLESCLDRRALPQVNDVLRSLFPDAAQRGLIPGPSIPFPSRTPPTAQPDV